MPKPLAQALANISSLILLLASCTAASATLSDADAVPHLDPAGRQAYLDFLAAPLHRAFAFAPGGYWSWLADQATSGAAAEGALRSCKEIAGANCLLYAQDDRVVFDISRWKRLWRPYLEQTAAMRASVGTGIGQRFHDLRFKDGNGNALSVSALQGKVLILHFWGSWCPSCRTELPDLAKLQSKLSRHKDVRLVLLQVREGFHKGTDWAEKQGLKLPFYDSGMRNAQDTAFILRDGSNLHDREIAPVFPSTYVLDKHGIVVFSHIGTLPDWPGYLPLLQDVARQTAEQVSRPLPSRSTSP